MGKAALLLSILASPAFAQPYCDSRNTIVSVLEGEHHEALLGAGLTVNGRVLELYASEESGSWTILSTDPQTLVSCVGLVGTGWVRPGVPS